MSRSPMPMPACPVCKTAKHVVKLAHHFCNQCKGMFDGDDLDEGGTYSNFDPSARIQREERQQAQKQQRRQR